jgi:hypothetical protein
MQIFRDFLRRIPLIANRPLCASVPQIIDRDEVELSDVWVSELA